MYKKRVAGPYDDFKDRIDGIKKIVAVVTGKDHARARAPRAAPKKAGRAAKDKP